MKNEIKQLASLVVFRDLYAGQSDIYSVIGDFITDLIKKESIRFFDTTELTTRFNNTYEFEIPEAVITITLRRLSFIKKTVSGYTCHPESIGNDAGIQEQSFEQEQNNNKILDDLFLYIEKNTNKELNNDSKKEITHSFCHFMLDESNSEKYSAHISAFIIHNSKNNDFKNSIEKIREAVILYSGIKYNISPKEKHWDRELTVYIETEIIFHIAGLNGETSKQSAFDFLNLVNEINNNQKSKNLIKLKYFNETKIKIDSFYKKAEIILEKGEPLLPEKKAMASIVNNCHEKFQILEKKSDLFTLLNSLGITEETKNDFYSQENSKYNIFSKNNLEELQSEMEFDSFEENLNLLNYINILRANNKNESFENVGYLLLSGNNKTLQLSWNEKVKDAHHVPLATHLTFITVIPPKISSTQK